MTVEAQTPWFEDEWCRDCGVNPVPYGGRCCCSSCQADEDFYNCVDCKGTSCTGACEDDEDYD